MSINNVQSKQYVTRHITNDGDLDFTESPFYWQNCNPSALSKTWHGFLSIVGQENVDKDYTDPIDKTDFEVEVIKTNASIDDFRKFLNDGQRFGTINITNAECQNFNMLKKMYGSVAYIVFEDRKFNEKDPRMKHDRHISFYTEYDLCMMNQRCFHSDKSYYRAITNKISPAVIASSGQMRNQSNNKETSLDKTRKKLYRNGFSLESRDDNKWTYSNPHHPTMDEYFSNKRTEHLDSQDMMNLLWLAIGDAHRDEARLRSEKPDINKNLAFNLYHYNLIGFGWMPCLFAKQELNELDKCIIHMYEKSNLQNDIRRIENASKDQLEKSDIPPGMHKILMFKNMNGKESSSKPTDCLSLSKVSRIDCYVSRYVITDIDGNKTMTDFIDLVDDIPKVEIQMSPMTPGKYVVTGRYADGRCIKYEMDANEWREHSYEIDRFIPGSRQAIQNFNAKQAALNGEELSKKVSPMWITSDDLNDILSNVIDDEISNPKNFSLNPIAKYRISVPDYRQILGSDGTLYDSIN